MHHAEVRGRVKGRDADDVFTALVDFGSYADYAPDIRKIEVEEQDDGTVISTWDVDFRGGAMQWSESDKMIPEQHRIEFEQTEGNLRHFEGHWQVDDDADGAIITFSADFAVGMPSLASFVDPIAERTITENITSVLNGLFGDAYEPLEASAPA